MNTSFGRWMALMAALLGWMFDGAEMGMFSMVGRDAIKDMLASKNPTEDEVGRIFGIIIAVFLVGAAAGGVLFGWLGDRIGRVKAMSLSVLVYALLTGLCGFARTPVELGILRFLASLGMGGEWALGVALVMEVWPNKSRGLMAGLIGAAANGGYLLVGFTSMGLNSVLASLADLLLSVGLDQTQVDSLVAYKGWRLMMMIGTLPALLTFFFRIFVPESHRWEEERQQGRTSGWHTVDLIGVLTGSLGPALLIYVWAEDWQTWGSSANVIVRLTGTLTGLAIATVGYTFPVIRYIDRSFAADGQSSSSTLDRGTVLGRMFLGACLSAVALLGTWGTTQWAVTWAGSLKDAALKQTVADTGRPMAELVAEQDSLQRFATQWTQIATAVGAIIGTLLAAWAGELFGRRVTYFVLCGLSMISVLYLYQMHNKFDMQLLIAAGIAGVFTASFYGWLPLYLPELFPTRVRATGQGFAFNFGRILAAIGTLQMSSLLVHFTEIETYAGVKGGYAIACSLLTVIYFVGMAIIWLAPETKGKALPE